MGLKRKLIVYPLIVLLLLAGGVVGVWYWIGRAGTTPLERWIGQQVKSIAGEYLNPKVEFDDIDYQQPYTAVLTKFRLTVDDPDYPGKTLDVIYVDKLRLELTEIPQEGKPIRIRKLILDHPKVNAIAARKDGKFMGFENLLKDRTGGTAAATPTAPPRPAKNGAAKTAPAEATRLSEVFQIVLLQIIEGQVVYESRGSGEPPMILDAINSRLDVEKDEQGWYKLAATMERKPVFSLNAKGRLDLDHLVLALDSLQLAIELGEQQYSKLPGRLQQILREHEVTAGLTVTASGRFPLGDPMSGELSTAMSMPKLHFVSGQYKGEAANVSAKLLLKDRRMVLDHLDANTLRGKVHVAADVSMIDPYAGRVSLAAKGIQIADTLRAAGGGNGEPKYKGVVNTELTLSGPMKQILTRSGGSGWLKLSNGHLTSTRVVADIGQALAQRVTSIVFGPGKGNADADSADLEFQFVGDKVHFTKIVAQIQTFALNGYGDVWFDKRLNLLLNGGPPDMLRSVLGGVGASGIPVIGDVGKILGTAERHTVGVATDVLSQVATIVVSGTIDNPKVNVEPFRKIRDSLGGK